MTDPSPRRLPPLPEPLARAADELRRATPSNDFSERLTQALRRVEQIPKPAPRGQKRAALFATVPALACAALVVYATLESRREEPGPILEPAEELTVALDAGQHTWVELELATHHHDGADTLVDVHASKDVSVHPTPHAAGVGKALCEAGACQHRFSQLRAHPERAPVRIGIHKPGRYAIRVEHRSADAHVREDFVVHAR